jgi:hypothetical protein
MTMTTTVILLVLASMFLAAYLIRRRTRIGSVRGTTSGTNLMLDLIFKSTALAMGGISFGAAIFRAISTEAHVVLLSLGLLALALGALQKRE